MPSGNTRQPSLGVLRDFPSACPRTSSCDEANRSQNFRAIWLGFLSGEGGEYHRFHEWSAQGRQRTAPPEKARYTGENRENGRAITPPGKSPPGFLA